MARPPVFLSDSSFPSKDLSRRVLPLSWERKHIQVPKRYVLLGIPDHGHGPEIPNVISCIFIVTLVLARKLRRSLAYMIIGTLNNKTKFPTASNLLQTPQCVCHNISKLYHFAPLLYQTCGLHRYQMDDWMQAFILNGRQISINEQKRGLYSVIQNTVKPA